MVSVLLLGLGNTKPGSSDELGGGINGRHRAGAQEDGRPAGVSPWKKSEPLDWRSRAENKTYPFAAKLHKESLKLFGIYSAVLGGLRRIRFLGLKAYSGSA